MELSLVLKYSVNITSPQTPRDSLKDFILNRTSLIGHAILNLCLLIILLNPALAKEQSSQTPSLPKITKQPICLHIASYAPGYPWQDGIDRGIRQQLHNQCRIKTFYMNSKKIINDVKLTEVGLLAKNFIDENHPDVVIVSDDNAVKYVLEPYFKNQTLPFVFCAVNNTAKSYGLPYKNTTGMIETAPTKLLLRQVLSMGFANHHIAYLTTFGNSADHNVDAFRNASNQLKLKHSVYQEHNQEAWRTRYRQLQEDSEVNIIILGNYVAFPSWDEKKNLQWVNKYNRKLTLASQPWMMPYAAFGMTKSPDEQGIWAASTALEILQGTPIDLLEIIPNQQIQTWINKRLMHPVEHLIPSPLLRQAAVYQEDNKQ